ncbi:MAG: hypothetical protein ACYC11_06770, partial [Bellilinea sp.]
ATIITMTAGCLHPLNCTQRPGDSQDWLLKIHKVFIYFSTDNGRNPPIGAGGWLHCFYWKVAPSSDGLTPPASLSPFDLNGEYMGSTGGEL